MTVAVSCNFGTISMERLKSIFLSGKIGKKDNKCKLCNDNNVETLEHFLLQCPYFDKKRSELYTGLGNVLMLNVYNMSINDQLKLILRFDHNNEKAINFTCNYIHSIYEARSQYPSKES